MTYILKCARAHRIYIRCCNVLICWIGPPILATHFVLGPIPRFWIRLTPDFGLDPPQNFRLDWSHLIFCLDPSLDFGLDSPPNFGSDSHQIFGVTSFWIGPQTFASFWIGALDPPQIFGLEPQPSLVPRRAALGRVTFTRMRVYYGPGTSPYAVHDLCPQPKMALDASTLWAISILRDVVSTLACFLDGREIPVDVLDTQLLRVKLSYREIVVKDGLSAEQQRACECIRVAIQNLRDLEDRRYQVPSHYTPPVCSSVREGRPRFDIPREQLEYLIEHQFTVLQMSGILGISIRTIRRRMSEFNLSIRRQYAQLTDSELDGIITEICQQYPTCGNRQLQGYLVSRGFRVQQIRIREAHRRIDPEGSLMRRLSAMHWRSYNVQAPRSSMGTIN